MKTRTSLLRNLAVRLLRHAASALPESRREWAEAMRNELEHVEDDLSALRWAAGCVVASYVEGGLVNQRDSSFVALVMRPTALVPLAMSVVALGLVGGAYVVGVMTGHGLVREPDEGTIAHLWQLLMAGQLPVLVFFAIKWLPRTPKQALYVLGIQVAAVLAAMAPVYFLHL